MKLQDKTIEKLRELINEETEYRTGPKLVSFFNDLGFSDTYGQGFPSRWAYTEDKLKSINGTKKIENAICKLFLPVNFIGKFEELDNFIKEFNEFLAFDDYRVVKIGKNIKILSGEFDIDDSSTNKGLLDEDKFLQKEFGDVKLSALDFDSVITEILQQRLKEIEQNLKSDSPLSAIFIIGSTLEGILFGVASKNIKIFNTAKSSPRDKSGKVENLNKWTLENYINTSKELGFIDQDVKKFSHALKDFRNYIHPYQQMVQKFDPDIKTAEICWKVLKLAISQISNKK